MKKETLNTANAPAAIGPYAQAVLAGGMLYTSGQLGIDPSTGELENGVEAQARRSLQNLGEILKEAGMSFSDVVKTTVFLANLGDFAAVNAIYQSFFDGSGYPARSCVQIAALPKGGLVEIECVAVKGE